MAVVKCDIPLISMLDRGVIESAHFRDAYRAPLHRKDAGVVDHFFAIFSHHPLWMKVLLIARNRVASVCGLDAPTASEIIHVQRKGSYGVGDRIGVWPIFALSDTELVARRDNKHLDFRVSVLTVAEGEAASVVVYLFFVVPFHKWGVQRLMSNAARAGRL